MKSLYALLKRNYSWLQVLILVLAVTTARVIIEFFLLDYSSDEDVLGIFQNCARFYLENLYYFLILFLLLVFFISRLGRESALRVANIGAKFFPVIWVPPLADYFIFGRTEGYFYATIDNFFYNFLTISWLGGDASPGISLEITLAVLFIGAYVFYLSKSLYRTIASIILTLFIITVLSTPDLFFGEGNSDYLYDYFLPLYYFFPLLILGGALYRFYDKEKFRAIVYNLRPERSILFAAAVTLGYIASFGNVGRLFLSFDAVFFDWLLAVLSILFVWWFSIIVNDIHDREIDRLTNRQRPLPRGIVSIDEYKFIGRVFVFFALSFSAVISWQVFLAVALAIILAFIYSAPPLRLRRYFLAGNLVIGLGFAISFMTGIMSVGGAGDILEEKNVVFSLLLLAFGVVVSLTKDLKDLEGDSRYGITNIYTLLGKENGKKLTAILLFLIINAPALFIKSLFTLSVTVFFGLAAAYLYYKYEDEKLAYFVSALSLIYIFLKFY